MFGLTKWVAAPVAAAGILLGFSIISAHAEDAPAKAGKGTISGVVMNADNKPTAGASVRLIVPPEGGRHNRKDGKDGKDGKTLAADARSPEQLAKKDRAAGDKGGRKMPAAVAEATTDAEGKFTMTDVPAGDYVILAMIRGAGRAHEKVKVEDGKTASVTLTLKAMDRPKKG